MKIFLTCMYAYDRIFFSIKTTFNIIYIMYYIIALCFGYTQHVYGTKTFSVLSLTLFHFSCIFHLFIQYFIVTRRTRRFFDTKRNLFFIFEQKVLCDEKSAELSELIFEKSLLHSLKQIYNTYYICIFGTMHFTYFTYQFAIAI